MYLSPGEIPQAIREKKKKNTLMGDQHCSTENTENQVRKQSYRSNHG